jgi:hypothetical protein
MTETPKGLASPRPTHRFRSRPAAALMLLATSLVACSPNAAPTASPNPTTSSTATPAPSPTIAGIQHKTGATDVVLRVSESGGFAPIEFTATYAPSFTLYGDGTIVFRDSQAVPPEPVGSVLRSVPFQTVRLSEEAVQVLLESALGPGGLGIATGPYMGMGADIPATTFTINVEGKSKDVTVVGLSPDLHPDNAAIVGTLSRLADKLRLIGNSVSAQPYAPAAYRGVLMSVDQPSGPVVSWPWTDVTPDEFTGGENEFFKTHVMTPAEVDSLGIPGAAGGLQGLSLQKDGKLYSFALRPLLPDEKS